MVKAAPKSIKLKLDGKAFDLAFLSSSLQRTLEVLNGLPADELLTSQGLMSKASVSRCTLTECLNTAESKGYTAKVGNRRYWGSPAAIKELVAQVGAQ